MRHALVEIPHHTTYVYWLWANLCLHWCSAQTDTAVFFIYFSYGKNIIFLALLQFNFLYELNAISLKNFWQFYGHKRSQFVLIPLQKLSTPHSSRLRFLLVFRWNFPVLNRREYIKIMVSFKGGSCNFLAILRTQKEILYVLTSHCKFLDKISVTWYSLSN